MPRGILSHKECLHMVCAICTNLNGEKPTRDVSQLEAEYIQKYIYSAYRKDSIFSPRGLCNKCQRQLCRLKTEKEKEEQNQEQEEQPEKKTIYFSLPEDYHCILPHETRSRLGSPCTCRWCTLARMNGPKFRIWKNEMAKVRKNRPSITWMCQSCGRGICAEQKSHTCSRSDL